MRSSRITLVTLLILALFLLVPIVSACGDDEASLEPTGPAATAANDAIAAVTKSPAIETPETLKEGVLQGGSDTSFPPMEFSDEKGGYIGFDVDLCTAIAKKMGLELETVSTAWDGIIPALIGDRFDIIMSAMTILPEREEQVNFTEPYLPGILAITAPIDAPVAEAPQLAGKVVGVQVDTTGQFAAEEVEGIKEIKKYGTILEAFQDMAAERIEAIVNDEPVNAYIIETNKDYKEKFANTGVIVTVNDYGYAIKKENTALLDAMNAALQELRDEGVYQKICDKWGLTGN